jgi:gamma-glutamylcyclotransferase (GGCT)/AIG2-like uncharacterized protein YtfP
MVKLFVYGTLMNDEIRENILGRVVKAKPDTLCGYSLTKHPILSLYPVVKLTDGECVDGMVFDVDVGDFPRLDHYESQFYKKINVKLTSGNDSMVYVENKHDHDEYSN